MNGFSRAIALTALVAFASPAWRRTRRSGCAERVAAKLNVAMGNDGPRCCRGGRVHDDASDQRRRVGV